jgi:hypothetical protein
MGPRMSSPMSQQGQTALHTFSPSTLNPLSWAAQTGWPQRKHTEKPSTPREVKEPRWHPWQQRPSRSSSSGVLEATIVTRCVPEPRGPGDGGLKAADAPEPRGSGDGLIVSSSSEESSSSSDESGLPCRRYLSERHTKHGPRSAPASALQQGQLWPQWPKCSSGVHPGG